MEALDKHVDGQISQRGTEHLDTDGAVIAPVAQRRGEPIEFQHSLARRRATVQGFADQTVTRFRRQRISELNVGDVVQRDRRQVVPRAVAEAEVPGIDHQAGTPTAARGPHPLHAVADRRNRSQRAEFHRHAGTHIVKEPGAALNVRVRHRLGENR